MLDALEKLGKSVTSTAPAVNRPAPAAAGEKPQEPQAAPPKGEPTSPFDTASPFGP